MLPPCELYTAQRGALFVGVARRFFPLVQASTFA
jgi:hypothetical protein